MIRTKVTNKTEFLRQVNQWVSAVRKDAETLAEGLAYKMLTHILQNAPQFSGDFAANWNVSVGSPNYTFVVGKVNERRDAQYRGRYEEPDYPQATFKRHDLPAIHAALEGWSKLGDFKLGQTLFLANGAEHDEPYAMLIEDEKIKFRPENVGGGRLVARAVQYAQVNYKYISRANAPTLRAKSWA